MNNKDKIYKLREETGFGLMDCKKALLSSKWDIEKAKLWLKNYINNNPFILR